MSAFSPGDRVRVRETRVAGHVRTPAYVRGKRGIVERVCGAFANPEDLAYGRRDGPHVVLYRIRFLGRDLFGTIAGARDTIDVELYEHWLERASA